jgi:hypothetical protein
MSSDDKYGRHLEKRAEELGLPTDPAAYQDGGLVPAATAINLAEADTLAAVLNAHGVPAWVDSPLSALYSDGYQRPRIAVLVPLGRLADAHRLIAQHAARPIPPEEGQESPEGAAEAPDETGEAPAQAEEGPPEPAAPADRRRAARVAASIIILLMGLTGLTGLVFIGPAPSGWDLVLIILGTLLNLVLCGVGILGLRRPRESRP